MHALKAYLANPKVKQALKRRPGDKGFSLIELVVVVAVLAVLAAIAIPSFTNISEKSKATAAMNTMATVAKECATKIADAGSGNYNVPSLQGYTWEHPTGTQLSAGASGTCSDTNVMTAASTDLAKYPTFNYNTSTGAKTCSFTASSAAANRGCTANSTW